jgi:superfamily I DNA/RNA helicase
VPAVMPGSSVQRPVEIADLFAIAAVVEDPLDQAHLLRVLSSPLGALSDASLRTMCREPAERQQLRLEIGEELTQQTSSSRPVHGTLAKNMLDGSADAGLSPEARTSVRALREDLARWRFACKSLSRTQQLFYLARAAGFWDRWHGAPTHERPRLFADLERIATAVARVEAARPKSGFAEIETLLEDQVVPIAPAPPTPGAVAVEKIVGCKGRRFDHVFVCGVAHERFPRIYTSHAMAFSRTYGLIVRENVARGASQTAKFAWYYARFAAKRMYLDEERRALDYGLSRGAKSATATGFGYPPNWARDQDLLARFEGTERQAGAAT